MFPENKNYRCLGLMSGSSLDGLDIACVDFELKAGAEIPNWKLVHATTIPFTEQWQSRLQNLPKQNALVFAKTNTYFGHYTAELVNRFIQEHQFKIDFIASHGHTVFHYPEQRVTVQIGDGAAIAALTKLPVICDFRTQDIAINGEGTPLAPIADKLLFPGHDFYLNIGGIANVTATLSGGPIAFDIGPANQMFNFLANQINQAFDRDGAAARTGKMIPELFDELDKMEYFKKPYPKSLDNNWIKENILPKLLFYPGSIEDKLHTACEQLARQTGEDLMRILKKNKLEEKSRTMLVTGGGAFNAYLMERLSVLCKEKAQVDLVIPNADIIAYKEAVLMALMGVLRIENLPNCLSTVTGAKRDTIGGAIYLGT